MADLVLGLIYGVPYRLKTSGVHGENLGLISALPRCFAREVERRTCWVHVAVDARSAIPLGGGNVVFGDLGF